MAEKDDSSPSVSAATRPTITLPPRPSFETFFSGGPGLSPGPMTLVSSFFAEASPNSDGFSFSQLLAGAMASPVAISGARPSSLLDNSRKEEDSGDGNERNLGFKQSRPMNLVAARSPLFVVPPGVSPSGLLNSPGFFSPQSPFGMSHQQALAQVTAQAALAQSHMHFQGEYPLSSVATSAESLTQHPSFVPNATSHQQMQPLTSDSQSSVIESSELSHSDKILQAPSLASDKPANDGYNWRKYGQKQVKGSEYPRSYYKCTHLRCLVKKKVERSPDGQITEIVYKGQHNHELPKNKRTKDVSDLIGPQVKPELGFLGQTEKLNKSNEKLSALVPGRDGRSTQATSTQLTGSSDGEEVDDAETRVEERNDDEPNPKRRSTEVGTSELASPHKTVTEPRIIVQTRSEVDLLDDGYRWRKYGQKVVKGNPHPRSYYKCTYAGCNVRKHVERASTDPKAVITTYEGKHNHDVPAARNSSHNMANSNDPRLKPHKVLVEKHALLKEMNFGNNDQRPGALRLKKEQITV